MSKTPNQPRRSWVWLVVRASTIRRKRFSRLAFWGGGVLSVLVWVTVLQFDSDLMFGKNVFDVWLAATVLYVIMLLWFWLVIRWVDRNGLWP